MPIHNHRPSNRQSLPRSLTDFLCGEERIKHPVANRFGNTATRIANLV
jgi:hypothetical protein